MNNNINNMLTVTVILHNELLCMSTRERHLLDLEYFYGMHTFSVMAKPDIIAFILSLGYLI